MHADSNRDTRIVITAAFPDSLRPSNQNNHLKHQSDSYDNSPNPADTSYVNRNEESGFMKDMSFNQSFAGVHMDFDDLENNPRRDMKTNASPSQSPSINPDFSPMHPFILDNSRDFHLVPIISLSSELESPNQQKILKKSNSNHSDKNLSSKTGLKGLKLRSRILSGAEEQDETKQRDGGSVNNTTNRKYRRTQENEEVKEEQEEEEEKGEVKKKVKDAIRESCSSSKSEAEKICKICLESYEDENTGWFVAPCKCTGSVKNIHELCLKTWIDSKRIEPKKASCELCHTKYKLKFKYRRRFKPKNAIQEGIVSLISGLCLLGMVIGLFVLVVSLLMATDLTTSSNSQGNSDDNTSSGKKSGASVKVFISLICGVFIAVLSFLLCYSWREAFFVPEVLSWEVLDYNKAAQKRRKKRLAAYLENQAKALQVRNNPSDAVQVENIEDVHQQEEERNQRQFGRIIQITEEGQEQRRAQVGLDLSKFKSNATDLLHLSPEIQIASKEELRERIQLKNLSVPTNLYDQNRTSQAQDNKVEGFQRQSQTELAPEFSCDLSRTNNNNEFEVEKDYTENLGEVTCSLPDIANNSVSYARALSI